MKKLKKIGWAILSIATMTSCKKYDPPVVSTTADVYISGYTFTASNALVGTYWKNGTPVIVPGTRQIKSIAKAGADLYLLSDSGYWKNNVYTAIPDIGGTYYMLVSGNDVYVTAGFNSPAGAAAYWKNGVLVSLPPQMLAALPFPSVPYLYL